MNIQVGQWPMFLSLGINRCGRKVVDTGRFVQDSFIYVQQSAILEIDLLAKGPVHSTLIGINPIIPFSKVQAGMLSHFALSISAFRAMSPFFFAKVLNSSASWDQDQLVRSILDQYGLGSFKKSLMCFFLKKTENKNEWNK